MTESQKKVRIFALVAGIAAILVPYFITDRSAEARATKQTLQAMEARLFPATDWRGWRRIGLALSTAGK